MKITTNRRGAIGKYLLLVLALALLVGWFVWKQYVGVTGVVVPFPQSTAGLIAFVREENGKANLFTVKADGSGLGQLTDSTAGLRSPAWSPDGSRIAYVAEPSKAAAEGRAFQLFIKGASADSTQLTTGSISKDSPQWSPDGKFIAFLTGGAIKVIEPNGSNLRQVYPPPHKSDSQQSAGDQSQPDDDELRRPPIDLFKWATQGSAVVARQIIEGAEAGIGASRWWEKSGQNATMRESSMIEPESLVLLPSLDGKPQFMPATRGNQISYTWFGDGNRVAVAITGQKGLNAIVICRVDDPQGPPQIRMAAEGYTVAPQNISISPDGKKLAFELWRMESAENRTLMGIAVIPTEGDILGVKTKADIAKVPLVIKGDARNPLWSPDGSKILYTSTGSNGMRDLWISNADGSSPLNLTKGAGDNYDAAFSPAKK